MDAKKTISGYIGGKAWMPIAGVALMVVGIALIDSIGALFLMVGFFFLLFGLSIALVAIIRGKKYMEALEVSGQLEKAAAELDSPNKRVIGKNRAILTENFLFCRGIGVVIALSDVAWAYKHRLTQRVFLIPIHTVDSLMVGTGKKAPIQILNMGGKDKNDELNDVLMAMYNRNPQMLVGYNAENQKAYKALRKQNV